MCVSECVYVCMCVSPRRTHTFLLSLSVCLSHTHLTRAYGCRDVEVLTAVLVDTLAGAAPTPTPTPSVVPAPSPPLPPLDHETLGVALATAIALATRFYAFFRLQGYAPLVHAAFQLYLDAPAYVCLCARVCECARALVCVCVCVCV
jgi:hypothetical protein